MSEEESMSDEEAIMKIAAAMKGNEPTTDDRQSVPAFLFNVATAKDTIKVGNLSDDKENNELGIPKHNVRGSFHLARISDQIIDNPYFTTWFNTEAESTLATSLSKQGFLVRQATSQTKIVADATRRRKINKGWFGKSKVEESGGDPSTNN